MSLNPTIRLDDFSGGLNLLDDPAPNEAINMLNVQIDRQGRAQKRLGYAKDGGMAAFGAPVILLHYSSALAKIVVQEGVNVRKRDAAGTFSLVKAFTTDALVSVADFNGKLLMLHPVDGLFSYTSGGVLAGPHGGASIKGVDVAAFQNKVWVAVGSATTAERTRVYFSAPGNETDWSGAGSGSVDLREVDDEALTALAASPRLSLIAFKERSAYRIHDSSTGAFTTIDPTTGVPGTRAVHAADTGIFALNDTGLYFTDGLATVEKISAKLNPFFTQATLGVLSPPNFILGSHSDGRILASVWPTTETDYTFEYDPRTGAFSVQSFLAAGFVYSPTEGKFFIGGGGQARVYELGTGGSDDGVAISAHYQTPWLPLNGGDEARLQRLHVLSRGDFSLYVRTDRATTNPTALAVDGSASALGTQDFYPRKIGKEFSFRLEESSSLTGQETRPLGALNLALGAFALHALHGEYTPLT